MYDIYLTFINLLNKSLTIGCNIFKFVDLLVEITLNILRILPVNQDICLTFFTVFTITNFPHYNTSRPTLFQLIL